MSVGHYENFPVGSLVLPRRLRRPVHAIYAFARTADDIADEGDLPNEERLRQLDNLRAELDRLAAGHTPHSELMQRLEREAIRHFGELVDYARRSANPIGRLLLYLYGHTDPLSLAQSDGICTALQLINFWQDVAVDWQKGRVYLPQEDLEKFGVSEAQIAEGRADAAFQRLMAHQCQRAHKMLKAGSPLGKTLHGRIGFELRLIILGGQSILRKLEENRYNVFTRRPVLGAKDWWLMLKRAWLKK